MNALSRLLFAGFSVGGLAAGFTAPAHATLQFTIGFVGSEGSFTCVDNSACDTNAAVGIIDIPSISFEGLVGTDIVAESFGNEAVSGFAPASAPGLSYSVGSLFNGSGVALNGRFALSDTNFRGPARRSRTSANVEWTDGGDSSLDLGSFLDTNNAQGGNTPTDAPGDQIFGVSFAASEGDQSESQTGFPPSPDPFSLSDQGTLLLKAGATVSGGQSITVSDTVPEPSTWAMMAIGFAGLGFAGYKRARRRPALVG
jgi:PEP-CTERM motif